MEENEQLISLPFFSFITLLSDVCDLIRRVGEVIRGLREKHDEICHAGSAYCIPCSTSPCSWSTREKVAVRRMYVHV